MSRLALVFKIAFNLIVCLLYLVQCDPTTSPTIPPSDLNQNFTIIPEGIQLGNCPPFERVKNGNVLIREFMGQTAAFVTCDKNYTLVGKTIVLTECVDGIWKFGFEKELPKCQKRCPPPPYLEHGDIDLEKKFEDLYTTSGTYSEGTMVTYTCKTGYVVEPSSSAFRVCENGLWSGTDVFCKLSWEPKCARPRDIDNGYTEPVFSADYTRISVGQEVEYRCHHGYKIAGSAKLKCTDRGVWSAGIPSCHKETDPYTTGDCRVAELLDPNIHSRIEISSIPITSNTNAVEVICKANYQNILAPCQSSKFYCEYGKWVGRYPHCSEVNMCRMPPAVPYGVMINRNPDTRYDSEGRPFFPINAQITYECLKGYLLDGDAIITCQTNGCWEPNEFWPTCVRTKYSYFIELDNLNAILISSATGVGVLGILLLACLVVACKKRKTLARAVSLPPPTAGTTRHAPDVVNDHAVLLQHPDRLALIAFAEGVQNNQNNSLPSYDEATRDRSTVIQVSRLQIQRPHWPNLAICRTSGRNRGSPNIDSGHHVARHGSFASHTPSMRSGGESMGSTETVTISEGSTNITLDTASSHSAVSQNPSCRGHCGSLASFDGCSVINTEGIPLLEESELEEVQGGTNVIENPMISDNTSSKISTHSAPMLSN